MRLRDRLLPLNCLITGVSALVWFIETADLPRRPYKNELEKYFQESSKPAINPVQEKKPVKREEIQQPAPDKQPSVVVDNLSEQERRCLALNIYHESRGLDRIEWAKTAHVTINRAKHPAFPSTICGVVLEYAQFSWTLESYLWKVRELDTYKTIYRFTYQVTSGKWDHANNGETFYHNPDIVTPKHFKYAVNKDYREGHVYYQLATASGR